MRAISDTDCRHLPPRAKLNFAGGPSDLESLKSGKDKTKLWCALKNRNEADLHRVLSRLPRNFLRDLALSGRLIFSVFARATCFTLHRPNCVCYYGL